MIKRLKRLSQAMSAMYGPEVSDFVIQYAMNILVHFIKLEAKMCYTNHIQWTGTAPMADELCFDL